ncbi:hypothetical protein STEG23_009041, partial [Scotinomys teguina]
MEHEGRGYKCIRVEKNVWLYDFRRQEEEEEEEEEEKKRKRRERRKKRKEKKRKRRGGGRRGRRRRGREEEEEEEEGEEEEEKRRRKKRKEKKRKRRGGGRRGRRRRGREEEEEEEEGEEEEEKRRRKKRKEKKKKRRGGRRGGRVLRQSDDGGCSLYLLTPCCQIPDFCTCGLWCQLGQFPEVFPGTLASTSPLYCSVLPQFTRQLRDPRPVNLRASCLQKPEAPPRSRFLSHFTDQVLTKAAGCGNLIEYVCQAFPASSQEETGEVKSRRPPDALAWSSLESGCSESHCWAFNIFYLSSDKLRRSSNDLQKVASLTLWEIEHGCVSYLGLNRQTSNLGRAKCAGQSHFFQDE